MAAQAELSTLPRRRRWVNAITRYVVALGGASVIAAIALIFFYLVWVVAPIFGGAEIETGAAYRLPEAETLLIEANESGEIGLRITASGDATFFDLATGAVIEEQNLGHPLRRVKPAYPQGTVYAVLTADGGLTFFEATYVVQFDDDVRSVRPAITPVFEDRLALGSVDDYDSYYDAGRVTVVSLEGQQLRVEHFRDAEPGYPLEFGRSGELALDESFTRVFMGPRARWVYLVNDGGAVEVVDISRPNAPRELYRGQLVRAGTSMSAVAPLLGRYSLLVGNQEGMVTQWFMVRDEFGYSLKQARRFELGSPAEALYSEQRRKGFAAVDRAGTLHLLHSTSGQILTSHPLEPGERAAASISPRANLFLTAAPDGAVRGYRLHNEHPEISFSTLWGKVWYEGYEEPVYSWQSSSADNDFEPKFSLTPLLFGTLKAAFYAMVFAVPIAIMGAIYTAYFMAPTMRRMVKPGIEIMAALPTVILGFLAGLWLAPVIEANLASVMAMLLVLPVSIFVMALLWSRLPDRFTSMFDGWYGLLILPGVILTVVAAFALGPTLENVLFGGNTQAWFLTRLGLDYDQRNALVVGLAMGLSVIPIIFSIAEDAIYGVPTHLINGSLALGATPWQTLVRVVMLTASPGIFSAIMIGLGRAVGETMIVLMATGNTPVMDLNIFQGMRTFAANIAVELPESEVNSTHYRILFLTALVLFMITFVFNTAAEVVRQRLRVRYGNL